MKLFRVPHPSGPRWAIAPAEGGELAITQDQDFAALAAALMCGERVEVGARVEGGALLAPCVPSKIICVGLNYRHHAVEMNKTIPEEPLIFMKPVSALWAPGGVIRRPAHSQLVHHEAELALVVGRRASHVSVKQAPEVLLGYTCANDVTARDVQRREGKYTRAKGYDTFCPVGPCVRVASAQEMARAQVTCRVNGQVRQRGRVDDLIFGIPQVVSFVSEIMTLEPGDLILTGTPSGVGELVAGDVVEVEVTGVGVLRNEVA